MNILTKLPGNYIGTTFGKVGSLYLTIEEIKDGIFNEMYKFKMSETKLTIPTTKIYTMILSKIDIIDFIANDNTNIDIFIPTEKKNEFINVTKLQINLNKNIEIDYFDIIFNTDYNFLYYLTRDVRLRGFNIVKIS